MKKLSKFLVLLLFIIPLTVNAEVDTDNVQIINGSSVTTGTEVTCDSKVNGINFLFGNQVTFKGNSDYGLYVGVNVDVEGTINNDGLFLGSEVNVLDTAVINRDLLVVGEVINLSGTYNRDVTIYGNSVDISNASIEGNVKIVASQIIIDDTTINGELSYNEDASTSISENAIIASIIKSESITEETTVWENITSIISNCLSYVAVFLVLAILVPKLFEKVELTNRFEFLNIFSTFGFGVLSLILIPMLCIVLFSIGITSFLALLLLFTYIILILVAIIFVGYLIGYLVWDKLIKKSVNQLIKGTTGVVIMLLLTHLPYIGVVVFMISIAMGMGIIVKLFKKDLESN